jgi:hypothetical protein
VQLRTLQLQLQLVTAVEGVKQRRGVDGSVDPLQPQHSEFLQLS